jgi:uncharacterized integral membrane protein
MWIFRYFLPAVFAVALGIFVAQNIDQRSTIEFLFWSIDDVPLMLIIAITLVVGIFIRYYVIFLKWLEKKRLEQTAQKIIKSRKSDEEFKLKKDSSKAEDEDI